MRKTILITSFILALGGTNIGFAQSDAGVQKAQEMLKAKGYYHGNLDGIAGPETHEAVTAFQKDQGLPATGDIDDKTVGRLGAAPTTEVYGTIKGATKQTGSEVKSESKSAFAEMLSVFTSKKPKSADTVAQTATK